VSPKLIRSVGAVALVVAATLVQAQEAQSIPEFSYQRALHTTFLDQNNPKFPGEGEMFCAPTSTAMEFSFLVQQGFKNLLPDDETKHAGYLDLIEQLGSPDFMDTSGKTGTRTLGVVEGVTKYVQSVGYTVKIINYTGVNGGQLKEPAHVVNEMPDFDFLRQAVNHTHSIVLMNVGYYKLGPKREAWRRTGGHWVAVVGYGTDGTNNDPSIILLHNPAYKAPKLSRESTLADRLAPDVARVFPTNLPAFVLGGRTVSGLMSIEGPSFHKRGEDKISLVEGILSINIGS
jgi:hypothetical protein